MSELFLLGLVERAETVPHAQAEGLSETNRRLESRILSNTLVQVNQSEMGGTEPRESTQTRSSWLDGAPSGRSVRLKKQVAIRDQAAHLCHIKAVIACSP